MNALMKDQDYFENETERDEIAELRDSLLQPDPISQGPKPIATNSSKNDNLSLQA